MKSTDLPASIQMALHTHDARLVERTTCVKGGGTYLAFLCTTNTDKKILDWRDAIGIPCLEPKRRQMMSHMSVAIAPHRDSDIPAVVFDYPIVIPKSETQIAIDSGSNLKRLVLNIKTDNQIVNNCVAVFSRYLSVRPKPLHVTVAILNTPQKVRAASNWVGLNGPCDLVFQNLIVAACFDE